MVYFELPGSHVQEIVERTQPISQPTDEKRKSLFPEGVSDGFTEYLALYGALPKVSTPKPITDLLKADAKYEGPYHDGLIPTATLREKKDREYEGIQAIPNAEPGLEPVRLSQTDGDLHEDTHKYLKEDWNPITSTSIASPKDSVLSPHPSSAELDTPVSPTLSPPLPALNIEQAELLLRTIQQADIQAKSPSQRSQRSPKRSLSRVFRRKGERPTPTPFKPTTLALGLQHAAHSGDEVLVATLLSMGARVEPVDSRPTKYRDALSCAAVMGHRHVIDFLMLRKCGINQASLDAAFLEACYAGQVATAIHCVVKHGANVNARVMAKWNVVVQNMPDEGGRITVSDRSCFHALVTMPHDSDRDLLLTFLRGREEFFQEQVVHQAFVVSKAERCRKGSVASIKDQFDNIKVLCCKYTALSLFASFGFVAGVRLLLDAGLKAFYTSGDKIALGTRSGHQNSLSHGPLQLSSTLPDPISCLSDRCHLTSDSAAVEIMALLLLAGADPHVTEQTENDAPLIDPSFTLTTPLTRAIAGQNMPAVNLLLASGICQKVDDATITGRAMDVTPLGLAIDVDDIEMVKAMVGAGWKTEWIVGWGPMKANGSRQVVTGLELARRRKSLKVLAFLRGFGARDEEAMEDEYLHAFERETGYSYYT